MGEGLKVISAVFFAAVAMTVFLVFCVNSCSTTTWNNGICPECGTSYELRGVSDGLKYYVCPQCKEEVQRF